jgi:hypothetical protein
VRGCTSREASDATASKGDGAPGESWRLEEPLDMEALVRSKRHVRLVSTASGKEAESEARVAGGYLKGVAVE